MATFPQKSPWNQRSTGFFCSFCSHFCSHFSPLYQKAERALCSILCLAVSALFSIPGHTKKASGACNAGGLYDFCSCFAAWPTPVNATPTAVMRSVAGKPGITACRAARPGYFSTKRLRLNSKSPSRRMRPSSAHMALRSTER